MPAINPKMMAHDVARGLMSISPASLKKYSAAELKIILNALNAAQREVRGKAVPAEEIKEKNRHLQNLAHAITLVTGYAKQHHIQI